MLPLNDTDPVMDLVDVGVADDDSLMEPVPEMEMELVGVLDAVLESDVDGVTDKDPVGELLGDLDTEPVCEMDPVGELVADSDGDAVAVLEVEIVRVAVQEVDAVAEVLMDDVTLIVDDAVLLRDTLPVGEFEGDNVDDAVDVDVDVPVAVFVVDGVTPGTVFDELGVGVLDTGVCVGDVVLLAVPVLDGDGVRDKLGVRLDVKVMLGVMLIVRVDVGVNEGVGVMDGVGTIGNANGEREGEGEYAVPKHDVISWFK